MVSPQHLRDLPAWTGGKLVSCDKRMAEFRKAHPCASTLGSPGRTVRRVEKVNLGRSAQPTHVLSRVLPFRVRRLESAFIRFPLKPSRNRCYSRQRRDV